MRQCEALVVEDGVARQCERTISGRGKRTLCMAHYKRMCKHGEVGTKPVGRSRVERVEAEMVGYEGMHIRLRRYFGPAWKYDCVDCGRQAQNWALIGEGSVIDEDGRRYSLDPDDYAPLCCRCHVHRDRPTVRARRLHPSAR